MSDVTVLHNPKCSTSRAAIETLDATGTQAEVIQYLKEPLDEAALRELIGKLEDEPTELVRRDSFFKEQGLTDAVVATVDQIVAVLVEHPRLMQRPVIVKGDAAIIGRPKDRVAAFLAG
ncbi:ArsC/Spx/MgsR family protein [Janibacter limosus]|uniref:ArsC/Spx/MgsR family protein n=1 Tax=Janibacter limosus TaxID=53458 RepID=UPI0008334D9A|nr:ArsC/Spx/MgsR family protein [Janibacter limosus]